MSESTETEASQFRMRPQHWVLALGIGVALFTAASGIEVDLVLVDENSMGSIMAANQAAGTLPDVVFHPLQRGFSDTE